jgi:hypothetical protein
MDLSSSSVGLVQDESIFFESSVVDLQQTKHGVSLVTGFFCQLSWGKQLDLILTSP